MFGIRELSNTANGQVTGKPKIELETYVQMAYFERILRPGKCAFNDDESGTV